MARSVVTSPGIAVEAVAMRSSDLRAATAGQPVNLNYYYSAITRDWFYLREQFLGLIAGRKNCEGGRTTLAEIGDCTVVGVAVVANLSLTSIDCLYLDC